VLPRSLLTSPISIGELVSTAGLSLRSMMFYIESVLEETEQTNRVLDSIPQLQNIDRPASDLTFSSELFDLVSGRKVNLEGNGTEGNLDQDTDENESESEDEDDPESPVNTNFPQAENGNKLGSDTSQSLVIRSSGSSDSVQTGRNGRLVF